MLNLENNEVCVSLWRIITANGYRGQKAKTIEELSELARELALDLRGEGSREAITAEMADCYVMLAQMELIYGNREDVLRVAKRKVKRTLERISGDGLSEKPGRDRGDAPEEPESTPEEREALARELAETIGEGLFALFTGAAAEGRIGAREDRER